MTACIDGYLEGMLLVASHTLGGSCFEKSVVYLLAHSEEGAVGLVINKPFGKLRSKEIMSELSSPLPLSPPALDVFFGGPVDPFRGFILHTDQYRHASSHCLGNGIAVTTALEALSDIDTNEASAMMSVGYSGWAPGQLEKEIIDNSWFCIPADATLMFQQPSETRWQCALNTLHMDMGTCVTAPGHA